MIQLIKRLFGKQQQFRIVEDKENGYLWSHIKIFGVRHRIVFIPVMEYQGEQLVWSDDNVFFKDINRFAEAPYNTVQIPGRELPEGCSGYVCLVFPKSRMYNLIFSNGAYA